MIKRNLRVRPRITNTIDPQYAAKNLANQLKKGRLITIGGGVYNLDNIVKTWTAVVESMALDSY